MFFISFKRAGRQLLALLFYPALLPSHLRAPRGGKFHNHFYNASMNRFTPWYTSLYGCPSAISVARCSSTTVSRDFRCMSVLWSALSLPPLSMPSLWL